MSIHINKFVDKIKMLESKNAKQLSMSMREAKDLHGDITKILLALVEMQERIKEKEQEGVQEVKIDGGNW